MIQNVLIVGAGDIGLHIADALIEQIRLMYDKSSDNHFKLFIHNRTHSLAQKTAIDLSSKIADQQSHISIIPTNESDLDMLIHFVDVIFYTAGVGVAASQKQGAPNKSPLTRHSNIQDNLEIVESFCLKFKNTSNKPYIIISANPSETLIRYFCHLTNIPSTKILGCGLRVDELRMNYFATEILNRQLLSNHQITTKCLGYHSAQGMVFPKSLIKINGSSSSDFTEISPTKMDQILLDASHKTKEEGLSHALIVGRSAYLAHAQAVREVFAALVENDKEFSCPMTVLFRDFKQEDYQQFAIAMKDANAHKSTDCCLGVSVKFTHEGARIDTQILEQLNNTGYVTQSSLNTTTIEALISLSNQEIQRSQAALNTRRDFSVSIKEASEYPPLYPSFREPLEVEAAAELYNTGQLIQAKHAFNRIKSTSASNEFRLRINLSLGVTLTMLHEYHGVYGAIVLYQVSLNLWLDVNNEAKDSIEYQVLSSTLDVLKKLPINEVQSKKRKYQPISGSQELSDAAVILLWVNQLSDQDPGCYKINKALPANDANSKVRILNNVGILCLALGQLDKAAVLFNLVCTSKVDSSFYVYAATQNAALVEAKKGEYAQSLRKLDETRPDMLNKSDPLLTASTYNAYGLVHYAAGNYIDAQIFFYTCLNVLNSNSTIKNSLTSVYIAYTFLNLAKAGARMITAESPDSDIEQTIRYARSSLNIFKHNNISYPPEKIFEALENRISPK